MDNQNSTGSAQEAEAILKEFRIYALVVSELLEKMQQMKKELSKHGIEVQLTDMQTRLITQINLHELVERVYQKQKQYVDERWQFSNNVPTDLPLVEGNPDMIEMMIDFLMGNAIKCTYEGGKIQISAIDEEETVRIDVQDEGLGIPGENQDSIFNDNPTLALVRNIAQSHGGEVWLDWSVLHQGSRFSIRLPKKDNLPNKNSCVCEE